MNEFHSKQFIHSSCEASSSNQTFNCFECGKHGHLKASCPTLKKNPFKGKSEKRIVDEHTLHGKTMAQVQIQNQKIKSLMVSHQFEDDEGLKHNLLSINQLSHKGSHVAFYPKKCIIEDK
ncbi:hypothetical protein Lal_00026867, partial [Lupinus albus]